MSVPPPPARRDWTVPIVVGAIALVVLLGLCIAGVAAAVFAYRANRPATVTTTAAPSNPRRPTPAPAASLAPADCLLGDWVEVSYTGNADIYGITVQVSGKGMLTRFAADGTTTSVLENVVRSGDAQGSHYEVVHSGSMAMHYLADAATINYSSPQATGTTTWKVDGKQTDQEPMRASLKPESYRCQGNDLRLYGPDYASELRRVLPPGTPA